MQCAVAVGVSGKHSEKPVHPLSSEHPRDIPPMRPIAVSDQVTSTRRGALRPSSETGPSTMQSTNQRSDALRPLAPTIQGPQRVGNMHIKPYDEKPRVGGGARRVLIPTAPLPESVDNEIAQTVRKADPPLVKPSLVAKSLISKRDPKNNPVATKIQSVTLATAAIVRPPSPQTGPRPFTKAEHPTTRVTGSRMGQSRSHEPPTTEVEPQTSLQTSRKKVVASSRPNEQAVGQKKPVWGGRHVTKALKPVVKALSVRAKPGGMKNAEASKPVPEDVPLPPSPTLCPTAVSLPSSPACSPHHSRQLEPAALEKPLQAAVHDTHIPRDLSPPCIDGTPPPCDINILQESPSKTPITALLSSIQRGFLLTPSSPLSPPQTYGTGIIAHAYPPDSPTVYKDTPYANLVHDCAARQVSEMVDIN
jgi:hypothetical protein